MISTNASNWVPICCCILVDASASHSVQSLSAEEYGALHAGDLLLVNGVDIGKDSVFSRWLTGGQ